MSKKKNKKQRPIFFLSAEENTLLKMPKFNGFVSGYGIHGDTKYNRNKSKKEWKKLIEE